MTQRSAAAEGLFNTKRTKNTKVTKKNADLLVFLVLGLDPVIWVRPSPG